MTIEPEANSMYTTGDLQGNTAAGASAVALLSIAISMKRIADVVCGNETRAPITWYLDEISSILRGQ